MSGIAEVISAHWSRSTYTNHKPHVDKCDGCGAVIYTWGDDPIPGGIEPLADHQAEVLADAGFGAVKEAQAKALEEAAARWSDWDALQAPEDWLRARAATVRDAS